MTVQRPESEARIAAMFDRIAPRYDLLNRLLSARQDQRWRRHLVARVPYRPGGCFADVATGTGDVILAVARAHPEYGTMLGVDISSEMLARARVKAKSEGAAIEYQQLSAEQLTTLRDGSCDALSISFGLRNVVDKEQALREFYRVLTPGGTLLILEFFLPRTGLMGRAFQLYFHHVLPFIGRMLSDRDAYRYLPQSVGSFYTPEALRQVLASSGFKPEATKNFLFGACRLVTATKRPTKG